MFVFGIDVPLVELLLLLTIIFVVLLIEMIIVIILQLYQMKESKRMGKYGLEVARVLLAIKDKELKVIQRFKKKK